MKKFDIAILGAGAAGVTAAIEAAKIHAKVALIERKVIGGVSLHEGCIPVKSLVASEKMLRHLQHAQDYGLRVNSSEALLSEWITRQRNVVAKMVLEVDRALATFPNITLLSGEGRLISPHEIAIVAEKGEEVIEFKHAVIATGSRPASLPEVVIDGKIIGTSSHFVHRTKLPQNLLVIGGGYIGCELGGIFASLGSTVTLIEAQDRLLPGMEPEASEFLEKQFRQRGMEIITGQRIDALKAEGSIASLTLHRKKREFDAVLVAVGRQPNTKSLGLEEAGVQHDRAIMVDHHLQTTAPGIYAVGDVNGLNPLAHSAMAQAKVAIANASGEDQQLDFRQVPYCVYTNPEITAVGHTEDSARKAGVRFLSHRVPFRQIGRSVAMGETEGFLKLIADRKTGRLLGGMIVGVQATELIGTLSLLIRMGATLEHLSESVIPHPSLTEAFQVAADEMQQLLREE